jgi:hypothetical protein
MMDEILRTHTEVLPPRLWFAIFGAPFAWAMQGLVGWYAASMVCDPRNDTGTIHLALAHLGSIEAAIGGVAILIAAAALAVATAAWRETSRRSANPAPGDFLATIAVFGSAIFLLGTLWACVPVLMLAPCETMR